MSDRAFEQRVMSAMADAVGRPPDWLLGSVLDQTQRTRPLPAFVALVTEPPMVLPSRVVVGVRRSRLLLVAAAFLLVVAALVAGALLLQRPRVDEWTMFGGAPGRIATGITGPVAEPSTRWTVDIGEPIDATPVIVGDRVLIVTREGTLQARDLATGAERWRADPGANVGGPAVDGDRVFVVNGGGVVTALRLADGGELWTTALGARPGVNIAVTDGAVYVATGAGDVASVDAGSGEVRWRVRALEGAPSVIAGLAVTDALVLVAVDAALVALGRANGDTAWTAPAAGDLLGGPTTIGGMAWVGPGDDVKTGGLTAYDVRDGTPLWTIGEPMFAPAVSGEVAVSISAVGVVSGRDAATSTERWRFAPGGQFRQAAVAGRMAYVLSSTQRQVYGLDLATGALRWSLPLDGVPGCCIAVARGILVAGTDSGILSAFESPAASSDAVQSAVAPLSAPSATPSAAAGSDTALGAVPLVVGTRLEADALGLEDPIGAAVAPSGDLYVTDTLHRVSRFRGDGTLVERWGTQGSAPGEFDFGTWDGGGSARAAIAVGADGLVHVSDAENHRVQVFTADGDHVRTIGSLGSGPGQFTLPFDLSFDADGDLYVLDDGAERVTKLTATGEVLWAVDQATDPRLIGHPHTAAFDSEGRLVVAIDDTLKILRLDPATGAVLDVLPNGGCESAVDLFDRIYVLDCDTGAMTVLDPTGTPIATGGDLRLRNIQFGADGRGIAVSLDGAILLLEVTPP